MVRGSLSVYYAYASHSTVARTPQASSRGACTSPAVCACYRMTSLAYGHCAFKAQRISLFACATSSTRSVHHLRRSPTSSTFNEVPLYAHQASPSTWGVTPTSMLRRRTDLL